MFNFVITFSVILKSKVKCHMAMSVTCDMCKYIQPVIMSKSKTKRAEWSVSQHVATSNTKANVWLG